MVCKIENLRHILPAAVTDYPAGFFFFLSFFPVISLYVSNSVNPSKFDSGRPTATQVRPNQNPIGSMKCHKPPAACSGHSSVISSRLVRGTWLADIVGIEIWRRSGGRSKEEDERRGTAWWSPESLVSQFSRFN